MHLVKDENGNICAHEHSHEHPHTHTYEHTHEHSHTHGHEDDHSHTHGHEDEHEHMHEDGGTCAGENCNTCGGCGGETADRNVALLTYMYQHNQSHAAELDQMAARLSQEGMVQAAEQIRKAVDEYQKGNMYLNLALTFVKDH